MSKIVPVASEENFGDIVRSPELVVAVFTAVWCGPCKKAWPQIERLAYQFPDVTFAKIDIDDHRDIASLCNVHRVPTFLVIRAGKQLGFVEGADIAMLGALVRQHNTTSP